MKTTLTNKYEPEVLSATGYVQEGELSEALLQPKEKSVDAIIDEWQAKQYAKRRENEYLDALIEEGRTEFIEHKTTKINPFNIWEGLPIQ